ATGRGVPQRAQLRSPGALATWQAGLLHRMIGPPASAAAPSAWIMKPQSMQATAPGGIVEPHCGQTDPAPAAGVGGRLGEDAGAGARAGSGRAAGAGPFGCGAGTVNGLLHPLLGQRTFLPAALSGTCICV